MNQILLNARQIHFRYDERAVLAGIDLALNAGDFVALIGPNGSGKTTLLKILAGILTPRAGGVKWNERDLGAYTRREIAQKIALVPQELNLPYAFSVEEVVALGRTPYARAWRAESRADHIAIERALEFTATRAFAARLFSELSGGEKQRVVIAMALAQEPTLLLLDEPTVHLDINHQIEILDLIRALNRERGLTVLATMHDLNLAALYFDRLILLNEGRIVTTGAPRAVLSREIIAAVFHAQVEIQSHPARAESPQIFLLPNANSI
ncbi:MAG: heme ABC transporter ATP-binding protein [Chloroflexi bacterium]|nr:heme ABC transporter ATP-binding protein [Chloroflexota bacterium]